MRRFQDNDSFIMGLDLGAESLAWAILPCRERQPGRTPEPVADAPGSDRMLDLHKQLSAAKMSHDKTGIQRQIDATDRRIDKLVYDLYGLTDHEIRMVEEATAR